MRSFEPHVGYLRPVKTLDALQMVSAEKLGHLKEKVFVLTYGSNKGIAIRDNNHS